MSILASKDFWVGTLERAIKTFAQSAVALITAEYTSLIEIDILSLVSVAGLAAVVSVLTRIAGAGDPDLKSQVKDQVINEEYSGEKIALNTLPPRSQRRQGKHRKELGE